MTDWSGVSWQYLCPLIGGETRCRLPRVFHSYQSVRDPLHLPQQRRAAVRIHGIDQKTVVLVQVVECTGARVAFPVLDWTEFIDVAHVLFLIL